MKATFLMTGLAALFLAGCGEKSNSKPQPTTNSAGSGSPITAPVDYLGAVAQAKKHSEKVIDVAQLNQAIMFFHEAEDRFPTDLNELVAKNYLREIPKAPYGMKIVYDASTGDVRVVKQ